MSSRKTCLRCSEPTPRRSGSVLPAVTTFFGGGRALVWSQRRWLPDVDGSVVVVHHWMLPRLQRHLDDRECCRRAQGAAPGRRTAGGGGFQHNADGSRKRTEGNGNRGGAGRRGNRRHGSALPPAPAQMGQGTEDVEHGQGGEGSLVPDGLHPRDRSPSLLEHFRPGSTAQHRSLHGDGLPTQRPQEGTHQIPHGAQDTDPPTTVRPHAGGQDLHGPTEGRAETTRKGEEEERVDFGGHVETR